MPATRPTAADPTPSAPPRRLDLDHFAQLLAADREETLHRLGQLAGDFDELVAATLSSNDDDEHDPEGSTLAFERSQVDALVQQAKHHLDEVEAAVARVAAELGAPTILVNNAGVLRDNLLFKMSASDWDTVMNVHLRGAFLMTRAVQKHMVDAKFGRVVNLSSSSALGNRGQANYSAAKAGLQGFTKTLAIELGKFGITANAVAPGFIVTDMTAATAARVGMGFEDFQKAAAGQIPVQRVGRPEDIANAIAFFTGEDAGFVSGQVLYVAGGPLN